MPVAVALGRLLEEAGRTVTWKCLVASCPADGPRTMEAKRQPPWNPAERPGHLTAHEATLIRLTMGEARRARGEGV